MAAAPVEDAARRDGEWLGATVSVAEVGRRLWRAMRDVAPSLAAAPPAAWALEDAMRTRPTTGRMATPLTSVYMDDGPTAGWLVAVLDRALRRSTDARAIGLIDDPFENTVLVPAGVGGELQPGSGAPPATGGLL